LFLQEEIMDIFKWITGQLPVPERVDNQVMRELQVWH
jgi:succinate dehydrogenase flavin-adding protein (antitoxin of CptAB toxin-antitoxin module)